VIQICEQIKQTRNVICLTFDSIMQYVRCNNIQFTCTSLGDKNQTTDRSESRWGAKCWRKVCNQLNQILL